LIDDNTLEMDMIVDSGFPVKKFINGDDIEPNLAKLLNTDLECKYFDLLDIIIDKSIQIVN
jgi:tRNA U54 and U55 pseudouridine synthase Pus10